MLQKGNLKFIAGPVGFKKVEKQHWFQKLEELDFLSLQGVTIGAFGKKRAFMCNAANLCFEKAVYKRVEKELESIQSVSGDDVFLLQKVKKEAAIYFFKNREMIVRTNYHTVLTDLLEQRIRWGKKAGIYEDVFGKLLGALVIAFNGALILALLFSFFEIFPWRWLVYIFFGKFLVDFLMIQATAKFFLRERIMNSFLWAGFIYPFFICWIACAALVGKVKWKGREFDI